MSTDQEMMEQDQNQHLVMDNVVDEDKSDHHRVPKGNVPMPAVGVVESEQQAPAGTTAIEKTTAIKERLILRIGRPKSTASANSIDHHQQQQESQGRPMTRSRSVQYSGGSSSIGATSIRLSNVGGNRGNFSPGQPVLRIQRLYRDEHGTEYHQTEIVEEPRLVENYLKIRAFLGPEQLRQFAFAGQEAVKEHKQFKRKLVKRFAYHSKYKKQRKSGAVKNGANNKQQNAKEHNKNIGDKQPPLLLDDTPSTSAAAISAESTIVVRQSPPGSSGYSTSSAGTSQLGNYDDGNKQKNNNKNINTNVNGTTTALQTISRGTTRRPNAGQKKRRFSPGLSDHQQHLTSSRSNSMAKELKMS